MTVRRLVLALGAIVLVECGNAVSEDLTNARTANSGTVASVPILNQLVPHTDFVAQCESAVFSRRSWSIPLAVVGAIVTGGALVVRTRSGVEASSAAWS